MYRPAAFDLTDLDEILATIDRISVAHLVTADPAGAVPFMATTLPLLFDPGRGEHGSLIGHVARANPHWRLVEEGGVSLAIFAGPDAYVSPNWYPTKHATGKAVPTWNYEVVHVHGELVAHDDASFVTDVVTRLTDRHEAGRPAPWRVADAPEGYIDTMVRGIVGVELRIAVIEAKRKLSQNRSAADIDGAITALESGTPRDREVAAAMRAAAPR